jgi:thioesterase domain-containing protein/acyl carrier protein
VAYVVPAPGAANREGLARELRGFLRARLPESHVPSAFVAIDEMPLNAHGKVDRAALPPPEATARTRRGEPRTPQADVERAVAQSFERVLGIEPIGVDDDFFDCGGASLAALRLVADLEDAFATKLPLVTLYEHPTVAGLAAQLRDRGESAPRAPAPAATGLSNLVEIRRGRSGTPLFVVPGGHGGMAEMTLYAQLMRHLRGERPVYGLLARGVDGLAPPHGCLDDMADACVDAVVAAWPRGPYAIAGECVGGVVAFEMARRLAGRGREVALLLLMDTWCPSLAGTLHYRLLERPRTILNARKDVARAGIADVGRVLREHVRDRPPAGPLRSLRYGVNVALTLKRVADPWLAAVRQVGRPAPGTERAADAQAGYVDLAMRHRPRPYGGRVTLLVSADNDRQGLADGWRRLAGGGLAVHRVPGDHDTYIRDTPEATAERLQACLDEALPDG